MHRLELIRFLVLSLAIAGASPSAADDSGETVARQQLITAAESAHKNGHHDVALEYAQRASAIRNSATLFLFIADEQVELNRPVDAYANAQQCVREVELDPKARLRDQALARCRALVDRLTTEIAQVIVQAPALPAGATLQVNGKPVRIEVAGVAYPVPPGPVVVEVTASGHLPFKSEVAIAAGETKPVFVLLRAIPCAGGAPRDAEGKCPSPPPGAVAAAAAYPAAARPGGSLSVEAAHAPSSATVAGEANPSLRRTSLMVAGGGVAVLAGAAIAWAVSDSKYGSIKNACDRGCTPDARAAGISSVQRWESISSVGFVAGGLAVATGAVLFIISRPGETASSRQLSLTVDPRGGVTVAGAF